MAKNVPLRTIREMGLNSSMPTRPTRGVTDTSVGASPMVTILGILNALKDCIVCPPANHLLSCIHVDHRMWQLLHRPVCDDAEVLKDLTALEVRSLRLPYLLRSSTACSLFLYLYLHRYVSVHPPTSRQSSCIPTTLYLSCLGHAL